MTKVFNRAAVLSLALATAALLPSTVLAQSRPNGLAPSQIDRCNSGDFDACLRAVARLMGTYPAPGMNGLFDLIDEEFILPLEELAANRVYPSNSPTQYQSNGSGPAADMVGAFFSGYNSVAGSQPSASPAPYRAPAPTYSAPSSRTTAYPLSSGSSGRTTTTSKGRPSSTGSGDGHCSYSAPAGAKVAATCAK